MNICLAWIHDDNGTMISKTSILLIINLGFIRSSALWFQFASFKSLSWLNLNVMVNNKIAKELILIKTKLAK